MSLPPGRFAKRGMRFLPASGLRERSEGGADATGASPPHVPRPRRESKYGAKRTPGLGPNGEPRVYDSKAEKLFADDLNASKAAGAIRTWLPQVSLPVGVAEDGRDVRYRADAVEIRELLEDGWFVARLLDRKGMDTPASRAKRAALRSLHGLDVKVVRP